MMVNTVSFQKRSMCHMGLHVKCKIAYLSLESRYRCHGKRFSACWSSPLEPWSAGGFACLGGWCPRPPRGCSPGGSVHPFELQESTFRSNIQEMRWTICLVSDKNLVKRKTNLMRKTNILLFYDIYLLYSTWELLFEVITVIPELDPIR